MANAAALLGGLALTLVAAFVVMTRLFDLPIIPAFRFTIVCGFLMLGAVLVPVLRTVRQVMLEELPPGEPEQARRVGSLWPSMVGFAGTAALAMGAVLFVSEASLGAGLALAGSAALLALWSLRSLRRWLSKSKEYERDGS